MSDKSGDASAAAFHQAALVSLDQGNSESALRLIAKAIRCDPRNLTYYEVKATIHLKLQQKEKAFMNAEFMIKLAPESSKGYLLAGKLLRLQGLNEDAQKVYRLGTAKVPKLDPGYERLAKYNSELKKFLKIEDVKEEKIKTLPHTAKGPSLKKHARVQTKTEVLQREPLDLKSLPSANSANSCSLLLPPEILYEICNAIKSELVHKVVFISLGTSGVLFTGNTCS
ncbi:hypothetical protein HDU96_005704 [Phlyctochytrium bullatum]|nr:hypothetical protein HDU96_005704 [Phlyctochytrium bullatum]